MESGVGDQSEMTSPRHYARAPIAEAVIDLRVADPAENAVTGIGDLANQLAADYPTKMDISSVEMGFQQSPNKNDDLRFSNSQSVVGARLTSAVGDRVVQLQRDNFTFSQLPPYQNWKTLKGYASQLWPRYVMATESRTVIRSAVRIINRFNIPEENVALAKWFNIFPHFESSLANVTDAFHLQMQLPVNIRSVAARCIINVAGGQRLESNLTEIILDLDVFALQSLPADSIEVWNVLDCLSEMKNSVFEDCITDRTRELIS